MKHVLTAYDPKLILAGKYTVWHNKWLLCVTLYVLKNKWHFPAIRLHFISLGKLKYSLKWINCQK